MKSKAIFFNELVDWPAEVFPRVWSSAQRKRLGELVDLHPDIIRPGDLARPEISEVARNAEFIFSTWGMPVLNEKDIGRFEKLKAVFYAAGTVQKFARPLLARNITVVSAWVANAVPVSEFTAAQVILALKRVMPISRSLYGQGPDHWRRPLTIGAYGSTVALISLGQIGRRVATLLKNFDVKIIAYEPYGNPAVAKGMGIELVSLEECFSRADVVSLHAPNLPSTKGMITSSLFALMKPHATFINTARGAIVDQPGMLSVLRQRPDITAIIDVTDPQEPPAAGSPYYTLPNLFLTPHIAGSTGNEVARMAEYMIDECSRYLRGEKLLYAVNEGMLETMA